MSESGEAIRIVSFSLHRIDIRLRMPFRYGIATMTEGPVLFVLLDVAIDGQRHTGVASDLLPPKWFTKIPAKLIAEEIAEMLKVIRHACDLAKGRAGPDLFSVWLQLYRDQSAWARQENIPPLLANFGVSLVERALIDAFARARGQTFGQLLQSNAFGIHLDAIHPELIGTAPRDFLPAEARRDVIARHTVGLTDPLTDDAIPAAERLDDGLPQSLESCLRGYGLRHFKIKIQGNRDLDLDRVSACAQIIQRNAAPDFAFSLDGNEQFKSLTAFRDFWTAAQAKPELNTFLNRLLFVEQPLHRDVALQPIVAEEFHRWPGHPPVIIDESDATLTDLPTALELGYAGTSHKNCKGIFKGIANRCLLEHRRRRGGGATESSLLMSGEDLCNIGPVALLQDLAVMAALGIESVERNGHHYHAGLSQFPAAIQETILKSHGDLYRRSSVGWPTLAIDHGRINLGSINRAPFGVGFDFDENLFAVA